MRRFNSTKDKSEFQNLEFLNDIRIPSNIEKMKPSWLLSDFYDNQWIIKTGDNEVRSFDWNRLLPNGLFLTSNGHEPRAQSSNPFNEISLVDDIPYQTKNDLRHQLNWLKKIVILFRHQRISRSCTFQHHYQFFLWLLSLTEWAFINEDMFQTRQQLFSLIDSRDLEDGFLLPLANGGKAELLNYKGRFIDSLSKIISDLNKSGVSTQYFVRCDEAGICYDITTNYDNYLPFDHKSIVLLRAWLYFEGYQVQRGGYRGRFLPEIFFSNEVGIDIKADTIPDELQAVFRSLSSIPNQEILEFSSSNIKEYLPSGQPTLGERLKLCNPHNNERFIDHQTLMLEKLGKIARHTSEGLPSSSTFTNVDINRIRQLELPTSGHTKTLPANIAMHALGNAVRFVIDYGDDLVDYAICTRQELNRLRNIDSRSWHSRYSVSFYSDRIIKTFPVPESLAPLNIIKVNSVYESEGYPRFNHIGGNGKAEFLRREMGIADALNLLLSSTIIIIGTTAARRQVEIAELPEDCLETIFNSGWYLKFKLGKNIFGSVRGELSRCIPNIAARAIFQMKKLNKAWRDFGAVASAGLFHGFVSRFDQCMQLSRTTFNRALDVFCDYIEIPLDGDGKRWYIRSHELRRFWAYTFFYKFGLSDLSTIGWYLGHVDAEQTWMYILESFDGHDNELIRIKAAYAADVLHSRITPDPDNENSIELIKSLVSKHLNRRNFSLVEEEDLLAYLENLIDQGKFNISPQFFSDNNGKDYKLIWIVNDAIDNLQ